MNKLKTLKDFEEVEGHTGDIIEGCKEWYPAVFKRDLRDEAVKWVKKLMEEKEICVPIGEKEDIGFWYIQDIQANWIKHFFNLTSEDIQNA